MKSLIRRIFIGGPYGYKRQPRLIRWGLFAFVITLSCLFFGAIKPTMVSPTAISLQNSSVNTAYKAKKDVSYKSKPESTPAANVVEAAATPSSKLCTPAPRYQLPAAITPVRTGLQTFIDTPNLYTVFGNSLSQINSQIIRCTPVISTGTGGIAGKYAANTGNTISWKISYSDNGTGNCQVYDAYVTLHINQSFPSWHQSNGSLSSAWQVYINKLHAYEQGHVRLDEQWAGKLLSDLENLPATNCQSISHVATGKANSDIAGSLAANSNYDIVNNFGLKQNVVL